MDKKMVNLKINDISVTVPEGTSVLEAARNAGIKIPSLCFLFYTYIGSYSLKSSSVSRVASSFIGRGGTRFRGS